MKRSGTAKSSTKRKHRRVGSPEKWLAHAQSDLNLARLAKNHKSVLPEQACFHAQQACEKALKAVLLFEKREFPLVHDIEVLLEIVKDGGLRVPKEVRGAGALSPYAVEARYPGYDEDVTPSDVEEAIRLAVSTVEWAARILITRRRL